jgi:thiamine phosphate synthase YjbQ (UPF0047 family)
MRQAFHEITVTTRGKGLVAFTPQVRDWVQASGIRQGCSPCTSATPRPAC